MAILAPIHWSTLMQHEREALDHAYEDANAGQFYHPASDEHQRLAHRLVDMGFLIDFGKGEYAPAGPKPEGV